MYIYSDIELGRCEMDMGKNTQAYYGIELRKCSYAEYQHKLKKKAVQKELFSRLSSCIHQLMESICQCLEALFSPEVISVFGIIGIILFLLFSS